MKNWRIKTPYEYIEDSKRNERRLQWKSGVKVKVESELA